VLGDQTGFERRRRPRAGVLSPPAGTLLAQEYPSPGVRRGGKAFLRASVLRGAVVCSALPSGSRGTMKKFKAIDPPKTILLDKPDEPRSTRLVPDLLTSEISLLLDYLSGLPERILTSHPRGHLPPGCETYSDALSR